MNMKFRWDIILTVVDSGTTLAWVNLNLKP